MKTPIADKRASQITEAMKKRDGRNKAPSNITNSEWGYRVSLQLPHASVTYRDSYCLLVYIGLLENALEKVTNSDSLDSGHKIAALALRYAKGGRDD